MLLVQKWDFPWEMRYLAPKYYRAKTNEKKWFDIYIGGTPGPETKETHKTPFSNDDNTLSVPDPTQGLGDTNVVSLELIQTDSGG